MTGKGLKEDIPSPAGVMVVLYPSQKTIPNLEDADLETSGGREKTN